MKLNEHPRCSCGSCRRGARSSSGQLTHLLVNRKIRHKMKQQLKKVLNTTELDVDPVVVSTPYTD